MALGRGLMKRLLFAAALLAAPAALAETGPAETEMTAPGPNGPLAGTLIDLDGKAPLIVIIPGSGPTDRNGDNRYGMAGGPYRQRATALAARGVATLRIDKRGMFSSRAAVADGNHVIMADYAADVRAWIDVARKRTGRACVWVAGHSEGGLVALIAAQQPDGICGIVHALRIASGPGPAASIATYGNAALPVAPALVETIAAFVKR